jgi:hypothetical protein
MSSAGNADSARGRDGNIDDPRTGDSGGELHRRNRTMGLRRGPQGVERFPSGKNQPAHRRELLRRGHFADLRGRWCGLPSVLPRYILAGDPKQDLTPAQGQTWDNQRQPENQ